MSESEKLTAFLLALQTSHTQRKKFRRDPRAEMVRFNLGPATINAVLRKDTKKLWRILQVPTIHVQVGLVAGTQSTRRRRKSKRT